MIINKVCHVCYVTYERWTISLLYHLSKDESLWSSQWCLIRTHHNYPLTFLRENPTENYHRISEKLCHIWNSIAIFFLKMRYADNKNTLDKYGGTKVTISIWAHSHDPHIPIKARNWDTIPPETTFLKNSVSTPNTEISRCCIPHF